MQGKKRKIIEGSKGIFMKMWRIFIILLISGIILRPVYAEIAPLQEKMVEKNIPQLELEDTSLEEQNMLDAFEVTKPSFFWYWVQKLGGTMVTRYTIIKQAMQKKIYQMKGWWCERKPN